MEAPGNEERPNNSRAISETLISKSDPDLQASCGQNSQLDKEEGDGNDESSPSPSDQKHILKALEVVERDSTAIAESFTSLFASLRLALSEVSSRSVDHVQCFSDAAGRLQECALDATTKGNRYINSCLRLNEEMKGIDNLAVRLKILRRNVDALDTAVNRLLHLP